MKKIYYSWQQFDKDCERMAQWAEQFDFKNIYGIPRGGIVVAVRLSHLLDVPLITDSAQIDSENTLIVDDSVNTGETIASLREYMGDIITATLIWHEHSPQPDYYCRKKNGWVIFPWRVTSVASVPKFQPYVASSIAPIKIAKKGLA